MKLTLPPLPELDFEECSDDTTFACDAGHSPETLRARDLEVARVVLEAAAKVCRDFDATDSLSNYGLVLARMIEELEASHDRTNKTPAAGA